MDQASQFLESIGLSHYTDRFREHGFDSLSSMMAITEEDLAALDVKRGDRRKLQGEIAHCKADGVAAKDPATADIRELSQKEIDPERRLNSNSFSRPRKYRRHPKPDPHAPKRPLTAYVRFSNDKRLEYREKNWSFPQLAKQIGRDWRNITNEQRMEYLSDAESDKREYLVDLERYRKTAEYKAYQDYLNNFNERHRPGKKKKMDVGSNAMMDGCSSSAGTEDGDQHTEYMERNSLLEGDLIDFHHPLINDQPELTGNEDPYLSGTSSNDDCGIPDGNMLPLPADDMFSIFDNKFDPLLYPYSNAPPFVSHDMGDISFLNGNVTETIGFMPPATYSDGRE